MGARWTPGRLDLTALALSGVLAAVAPLPTFLLAYVVLGPIHYLTEIHWLRKKSFYFNEGVIAPWLYGAGAAVLAILGATDYVLKRGFGNWLVGLCLLFSVSVWIRNRYALGAIAVAMLVVKVFSPKTVFLVAVFTPSLVHVFVFTAFFMMSGALRATGAPVKRWRNPVLLLAIPFLLFWLPLHYGPQGATWLRMEHISFEPMHQFLVQKMHHRFLPGPGMLDDPLAAGVLRVFAFIYLFHYLNWFSKAELLKWHQVPRREWTAIGVLYAVSLGLYAWNFTVGFLVTNFLGLLHVLLEFPLDFQAIRFVLLRHRVAVSPAPQVRLAAGD